MTPTKRTQKVFSTFYRPVLSPSQKIEDFFEMKKKKKAIKNSEQIDSQQLTCNLTQSNKKLLKKEKPDYVKTKNKSSLFWTARIQLNQMEDLTKKSVAMVINFVLFLVFHCKAVTNNICSFVNIIIIIYIWPVLKTTE